MKSVINNENTIIIKKSRFICLLYQVNDVKEANDYLDSAKDKYVGATHYCYAYIINNISKASDDGEPSGTAGLPILGVLKKNNLNNCLCIVIRYFGKILLGANGLVRAYTKSVTECLEGHVTILSKGYNITLTFPYEMQKNIDYILNNTSIINKSYDQDITYNLNLKENDMNKLKELKEVNIKVNKDIYL